MEEFIQLNKEGKNGFYLLRYHMRFNAFEKMICVKEYLSLNRILLLAIGLWPYKQSKFVQLQLILCYSILASFIVFQVCQYILIIFFYENC